MSTFADTGLRYITPVTVNSRERVVRSETLNLKIQTVGNDSQRWDFTAGLEPKFDTGTATEVSNLAAHKAIHGFSTAFTTPMPQYPNTIAEHDADIVEESAGDAPDWEDTDDFPVGHSFIKGDIVTLLNSDSNLVGYAARRDHDKTLTNGPADSSDPTDNNRHWDKITNDDGDPLVSRVGDTRLVVVNNDSDVTLKKGRFINFGNHTKIYMVTETVLLEEGAYKLLNVFPPLVVSAEDQTILHHDDVEITVLYAEDGQEGITVTDGSLVRASVSLVESLG